MWKNGFPLLVSVLSLVFAGLSYVASREATDISREALKRATGRIYPRFSVVSDTSHLLVVVDQAIDPQSVTIHIKNLGTEPIEAVRFEISTGVVWNGSHGQGQTAKPIRVTHEFNKLLQPGESDYFDIAPAIITCLKSLRIPKGTESYWTPCAAVFAAKVAGSNYYSSSSQESDERYMSELTIGVTWSCTVDAKQKPLNFGVEPFRSK